MKGKDAIPQVWVCDYPCIYNETAYEQDVLRCISRQKDYEIGKGVCLGAVFVTIISGR